MSTTAPAADATAALAKGRLGIPAVMFFILSAIAPMTVVGSRPGWWWPSSACSAST